MPEHVSLHSVSVQIVLIHGFIKQNFGLKSAYLPFRSSITLLSALVPRIEMRGLSPRQAQDFNPGFVRSVWDSPDFNPGSYGLAGTRTQGLRLAKAAIFQLIYEPSSWSRMAHESF